MQSYAGSDYTLEIMTDDGLIGPGLVLVRQGRWVVGVADLELEAGDSAVLLSVTRITGSGEIAVLVPRGNVLPTKTTRTEKPWGYELEVDARAAFGQLKIIHVEEHQRTSLQRHERKSETLVLCAGWGRVQSKGCARGLDGDGRQFEHFLPGVVHRVIGPATLVEGSTYEPDDVIRLEDDYDR